MKLESLEKGRYYHIYNRGINGCNIFENSGNYDYFTKLLTKYLSNQVTVFAYCLLSNHFHLVIKVDNDSDIVTQKFSNFFNAYAKAFNKQQDRTGSLFEKHFKRIKIQSEEYFRNLTIYVHNNPVKHGITDDFKKYKYSSYGQIIDGTTSIINSKEVIDFFFDLENFKFVHQYKNDILSLKYTLE